MGTLVGGAVLQYSINNVSKRTQIANTMEAPVDSALVTVVIFVPTEGGLPLLNISEMRKNLKP